LRKAKRKDKMFCFVEKKGQVTVELLLVLPVFFLLLFTIMEFGFIAHKVILVNHAAYEIARIGSLLAGTQGGKPPKSPFKIDENTLNTLKKVKCDIFGENECHNIILEVADDMTSIDPQSGQQNFDIVITLTYPVKLIFPMVNYFLADPPKKNHIRKITVKVRMPVEQPLYKSKSF
jgi:hypothetical protein